MASGNGNRYLVAGIDLDEELERLRGLNVFRAGQLPGRPPTLRVRRASGNPTRLGFAVLGEWRISVTDYAAIRPGDALEILLHELVHLHVGEEPGRNRFHGRRFKETLRVAMREAYGVRSVRPRTVKHGTYADAIERLRAERARVSEGQLELPIAA